MVGEIVMKQFNLEEYLKNPSRKVTTRDGRKVRIICTDAKGNCPVVGLVNYKNYEVALNATKNGKIDDVLDLFFASEKKEGWINIYKSKSMSAPIGGTIYDSEEEAETEGKRGKNYIATVKIEWEEE